jgi:hypothetical protein
MGERRGIYKVLVGKPKGKRPLGRSRFRWEDIKMDLQEVGVRTGSSWLRIGTVVGTHECSNEPSGCMKCREFLDWLKTG